MCITVSLSCAAEINNIVNQLYFQALPSMGLCRQEYWGVLPYPSPASAGRLFTTRATWEAPHPYTIARDINNTSVQLK